MKKIKKGIYRRKKIKKKTEKLCIVDTLLLLYIMKEKLIAVKSLIKLIT